MKIYIASSWRHEHAIRMLTEVLRRHGHEVWSFVEHGGAEERDVRDRVMNGVRRPGTLDLEKWLVTHEADDKFCADLREATTCNVLVYYGPAGTDAWAEVGAAWATDIAIYGITARGEPSGLMRKMVHWCKDVQELVDQLEAEQRVAPDGAAAAAGGD